MAKRITPMYKIINRRRVPICDYHGTCPSKAYREVYPMLIGKKGWSYLCRKHFEQERRRLKGRLPHCRLIER